MQRFDPTPIANARASRGTAAVQGPPIAGTDNSRFGLKEWRILRPPRWLEIDPSAYNLNHKGDWLRGPSRSINAIEPTISGSILAVPKARWAMMMALLLGPTRGAGRKPTRPARTDAALFRPDRPFPLIAQPVRAPYHPPQQRGEVPLAREQRKLAAILAPDAVGYSRPMGRDESGPLARLIAISTRIVAA
jgi:hypothetical protein